MPIRTGRAGTVLAGAGMLAAVWVVAAAPRPQAAVPEQATLVLRGGVIVTVDEARPEARALAVRGDRILHVGDDDSVKPYVGAGTRVIDLKGAVAIPGLIESHGHFMGTGEVKLGLDLMTVANWDEVVARVEAAVRRARPGQLIEGRGWHQEKWNSPPSPQVEGFPTHGALSRVSPDNPVILSHASGHATFANARAMAMAGITRETPNPPGGEILKDARGEPIGVFRETASGLLARAERAARASMTEADRLAEARRIVALASEEALSHGVTSFHDAGVPFETAAFYKQEAEAGRLGVRLYVMIRAGNRQLAEAMDAARTIGYASHHVTVRTIKVSIDGALGSRGAWLLAPYSDMPGSSGLNTVSIPDLRETARLALEHGYQLAVHAIGDRGNREALDIYEAAFAAHPGMRDVRWRIEHAQHLHPQDIPRFARLKVHAAMQGIHCTSDAPYVLARLGPARAEEGAYVWQKLMATGATISNGTDTPVEAISPLASFHATVTRRLKDGSVFYGDQKMTRLQALKSYTINGAYAAFEEDLKGSLSAGKLADITVLSQNPLTVPDDQLLATKVLYTIVGGHVRYEGNR